MRKIVGYITSTQRPCMCAGMAIALMLILTGNAFSSTEWGLAERLYGDKKARHVGDLLTVEITETSSSTKNNSKDTEKSFSLGGSMDVSAPTIDGETKANWENFKIPSWQLDTSSKYGGKGSMGNKDELTATIAARVVEVLPNGNLLIEGKRKLVVQNESVEFILTGTVRPEDISRENVVKSTAVADAAINYVSTGSIAKNQNKGWIPKLWDWINPF